MTAPTGAPSLPCPLDELDRRQDEVLRQLDDLNGQVLALLEEMSSRLGAGDG